MLKFDYIAYGERVHAARRRRRQTQIELAQIVGFSSSHLSDIERGVANPSYAIVMSLCAALDVIEPEVQATESGEV